MAEYEGSLLAGSSPTVLGFGFYANARCLVLAVLDGHHKLAAAATSQRPIHLLGFLSPRLLANFEEMYMVQPSGTLAAIRRKLKTMQASFD